MSKRPHDFAPELLEALKIFLHSVEHEGVIEGRVVDAVENAEALLRKIEIEQFKS